MKKVAWFLLYVLTFGVAAGGGVILATSTAPSFGGFDDVEWNDSVGTVHTDFSYGDGALNDFDLYVPADTDPESYKLVVYLHAGGFTSGDKSDDAAIAHYFVSKGYVAATVNYSLRTDDTDVSVYDMTLEIKQSIPAVAEAAAELGYPLDEMVIAGGSAGGTLAMINAFRDADESPIPVNAVINLVGPASFEPSAWFGLAPDYADDEEAEAAAGFASLMSGETVTIEMMRDGSYKAALHDVTALQLVSPDSPPMLAAYGALDKVAPYAASRDLDSILEENAVPHDVLVFPNSGHALNRDADLSTRLGELMDDYLEQYLPLQ